MKKLTTRERNQKARDRRKEQAACKAARPGDFPLYPHRSGNWACDLTTAGAARQRTFYFGRWAERGDDAGDPWGRHEALTLYNDSVELLKRGAIDKPSDLIDDDVNSDSITVTDLVDEYLKWYEREVAAGRKTARSLGEAATTCKFITKKLGASRAITTMSRKDWKALHDAIQTDGDGNQRSATTVNNWVARIRAIFNWAAGDKSAFDDIPPFRFYALSKDLKTPKRERAHRKVRGDGFNFESDQIKTILKVGGDDPTPAQLTLRACVLLGLNCGMTQREVAGLIPDDIQGEWLLMLRAKTGEPRKARLWQETRDAIDAAVAIQSAPANVEAKALLLRTETGLPVARTGKAKARGPYATTNNDRVTSWFKDACETAGVTRKRGQGFGKLRHTFSTVAAELLDPDAKALVMGRATDGIDAEHYIQKIHESRLIDIADHVHAWLFADE